MRSKALLVLLPTLFFALSAGAAQSPAALYNAGNAAYAKGEFEEAIRDYRAALDQGGVTAEVEYNLGNACLKAGQLGPAIVAYERALRLKPRDPDIAHNLRYARVQIKGKLPFFGASREYNHICMGI